MKKLVLCAVIFMMISSPGFSLSANQVTIGKIEDSLFGFQYNDESIQSRLNRLEQSVYGKTFSTSENERIAKLSKDVSANSIGKEIPPVEDTFAENEDYLAETEQESADVSYPVIDEMEQQVFKQVNKTDNIKNRLSKLEQKTFNKTYDDDLSSRVDRLRAEIKPPSLMENKMAQSYNTFYDGDIPPADTSYHLDKYVPPGNFDYEYYNDRNNRRFSDYDDNYSPRYSSLGGAAPATTKKTSIATVEKKLFKQSFNNESLEKRLTRVENSMFGTEFSGDDAQTRLERISSAYQAEKSAGRYDSNRFSQNMATAMQIGTILLMVLACIL